ncbi:membrane protein [Anopheles sinensis]|uniref:Membrane protein n=1 Tax=Anopheles sinensis TaxID=74873 RepID=A0A084VLK6_ANOSI|nr:membrane protein [Anopheles sinensis]
MLNLLKPKLITTNTQEQTVNGVRKREGGGVCAIVIGTTPSTRSRVGNKAKSQAARTDAVPVWTKPLTITNYIVTDWSLAATVH